MVREIKQFCSDVCCKRSSLKQYRESLIRECSIYHSNPSWIKLRECQVWKGSLRTLIASLESRKAILRNLLMVRIDSLFCRRRPCYWRLLRWWFPLFGRFNLAFSLLVIIWTRNTMLHCISKESRWCPWSKRIHYLYVSSCRMAKQMHQLSKMWIR